MEFLSKYDIKSIKVARKRDGYPLFNTFIYRFLVYALGAVSGFSTGYFIYFLARMADTPSPFDVIIGGIVATGFTIAYIKMDFDTRVKEIMENKIEKFWTRFFNNKFIYLVRFTTVMGTCMMLYTGIDLNDKKVKGREKSIELLSSKIEEDRESQKRLFSRGIVTATQKTVGVKIEDNTERLLDIYAKPESDVMSFFVFLAGITFFNLTTLKMIFVSTIGIGVDKVVSILTGIVAKNYCLSLKTFHKKKRPDGNNVENSVGDNGNFRGNSKPVDVEKNVHESGNFQRTLTDSAESLVEISKGSGGNFPRKVSDSTRRKILRLAAKNERKYGKKKVSQIVRETGVSKTTVYNVINSKGKK